MTDDTLRTVRTLIGERIAELEARMPRLAPRTIRDKMDAIRAMAAEQRFQHYDDRRRTKIADPRPVHLHTRG